jgi:hypothetical protein
MQFIDEIYDGQNENGILKGWFDRFKPWF